MKRNRNIIVLAFILTQLFYSCQPNENESKSGNNSINRESSLGQMLKSAPLTIIDIDSIEKKDATEDIILDCDKEENSFISVPFSTLIVDDTVYAVDNKQNCIVQMKKDGKFISKIGRFGSGPGEFKKPASIISNGNIFVVHDTENARLQVFNRSFKYLLSIPFAGPAFPNVCGINKKYLFVPNAANKSIIELYDCQSLLYEKLVISGEILFPQATEDRSKLKFHEIRIASSSAGLTCFYYPSLPYLFLYDESNNNIANIEFKGKEVIKLYEELYNEGGAIKLFFQDLVLNNNEIILARGKSLIILTKKYSIENIYKASKDVFLMGMSYSNNYIYTCNWGKGRIYRIKLN